MKRKFLTATLAAGALALSAAPAAAHPHAQANGADGFVGPTEDSPSYFNAHSGIQCAATSNPNLTSLASLDVFECPANNPANRT